MLPLVVFMLITSLEPTPPTADRPESQVLGLTIPYSAYPWIYSAELALTMLSMAWVGGVYRQFPFRVSPLRRWWAWSASCCGL